MSTTTIPALTRMMAAAEREMGASPTARQIAALAFIGANPGSSVREIAAAVGCPKPVITRAGDLMTEAGLITRQEGADDRRLSCMALTARGKKVLAAIEAEG